jgi:hypothetical protein
MQLHQSAYLQLSTAKLLGNCDTAGLLTLSGHTRAASRHQCLLACNKISAPRLAHASALLATNRQQATAAPVVLGTSRAPAAALTSPERRDGEYMLRQVVRVETLHRLPNSERPWEEGSEARSSSTASVVDIEERLLMTTAGAVEHAKRVGVGGGGGPCRAAKIWRLATCTCTAM